MEWVLSSTWIQSASRLDGGGARRVWGFHKKLLDNPEAAGKGFNLERVKGAGKHMMSLRIDQGELRAIVWQDRRVSALLYVNLHDDAYSWAGKVVDVSVHKLTDGGFAVAITTESQADSSELACGLIDCSIPELCDLGLPMIMVPLVQEIREESELVDELVPALDKGLGDRLLALYLGEDVATVAARREASPPLADGAAGSAQGGDNVDGHDAPPPGSTQALSLNDVDRADFERLTEHPTAWWVALPDPAQRVIAEGTFPGDVLVTGGPGTGKTIVALHRSRHLARTGKKVLLTSYSGPLSKAMDRDIRLLCDEHELERIRVTNLDQVAREITAEGQVEMPLPGESEYAQRIRRACEALGRKGAKSPFDAVIADETQDFDVARLSLLRALAGRGRDRLTLLGDAGQRIFGEPLDLEDIGISVEGRTFELNAMYRTTKEIAEFGQRILTGGGGVPGHGRSGSSAPSSAVRGPRPLMIEYSSQQEESVAVAMAVLKRLQDGVPAERIAVFARRRKRLAGVECALRALGVECMDLKAKTYADIVGVRLMTMHQAKGLEFLVVFVIGVSDDALPEPAALKSAETEEQRQQAVERERSVLHVSATRATHELHLSWVGTPTVYLAGCEDLAEQRNGFDIEPYLGVELDTAALDGDPAGFRLQGQDYVAGGRQIAATLESYLSSCEEEWTS